MQIKEITVIGCKALLTDGSILQVDSPVLAKRFEGIEFFAGHHVAVDSGVGVTIMHETLGPIDMLTAVGCLTGLIADDFFGGYELTAEELDLLGLAIDEFNARG